MPLSRSSVPRHAYTRAAARQRGMRGRGASRAEVTIDANLSECHVSTIAGTQYIHAMDDDDGTIAPHHSIKSMPPPSLYIYASSLAMGSSRHREMSLENPSSGETTRAETGFCPLSL